MTIFIAIDAKFMGGDSILEGGFSKITIDDNFAQPFIRPAEQHCCDGDRSDRQLRYSANYSALFDPYLSRMACAKCWDNEAFNRYFFGAAGYLATDPAHIAGCCIGKAHLSWTRALLV